MRMLLFILLLTLPYLAYAVDWQSNRLIPPEKITVGPWDNFEASVSPDGKQLYFTRSINQIPNIYQQKVTDSASQYVIGHSGDAKESELSPDQTRLLFTYYKYDAQGDVCVLTLATRQVNCLTGNKTIDESPYWVNNQKVVYLQRNIESLQSKLVSEDLSSQKKTVLDEGIISSPSVSADGTLLIYNRIESLAKRSTILYELKTKQKTKLVKLDLPGIPGFMRFSQDKKYVYFNHYLSDTNQDQVIDANDHSVIFRVALNDWLKAKKPILPEQLTSVEYNCKFPALSKQFMYLTCAFEGSLDIYRLPLTGSINANWDKKALWQAHDSALSYADRLLILNNIRFKYGNDDSQLVERVLSDHLQIGEYTAALFYIKRLETAFQTKDRPLAIFYQLLEGLIYIASQKEQVPGQAITTHFQNLINNKRTQLLEMTNNANYQHLINAFLDMQLNQAEKALKNLHQIDLSDSQIPMLHYLTYDLTITILSSESPGKLLAYYPLVFTDKVLSHESQIYYATLYLRLLGDSAKNIRERVQTLEHELSTLQFSSIKPLFEAELMSLHLVQVNDKKAKTTDISALLKLLKAYRNDLQLVKAMHIRAIYNLGEAEQFQYMELMSRNWLTITNIRNIAFYNVAEQYSVITMDKAYGEMAQHHLKMAYATFYSAIRQTNDLEAHYQFITLAAIPSLGKAENVKRAYAVLRKQKLLGLQENYVKALQLVMAYGQHKDDDKLDQALELLRKVPNVGPPTAMRELLSGYIYHLQFRKSRKGFDFDKKLYEKAHYHYMMALDFGRDNTRVKATTLQNLGWLHFEVNNYGISSEFFKQRMQIAFVDQENEIATLWAYSRSLFYNYQYKQALQESQNLLKIIKSTKINPEPYIEKTAFYAVQAEKYSLAISLYKQFLSNSSNISKENQAKATLGLAYAYAKTADRTLAIQAYQQVLGLSAQLKPQAENNNHRLISFQPKRLELIALGMLAQLEPEPEVKVKYLEKRIKLLSKIVDKSREFTTSESDILSDIIKHYFQIAVYFEKLKNNQGLVENSRKAMEWSKIWVDKTSNQSGAIIYKSLINYMSLSLLHAEIPELRGNKFVDQQTKTILQVLNKIPYPSDYDLYQKVKLHLFYAAYKGEVNSLSQVMQSTTASKLKAKNFSMYQELMTYSKNL